MQTPLLKRALAAMLCLLLCLTLLPATALAAEAGGSTEPQEEAGRLPALQKGGGATVPQDEAVPRDGTTVGTVTLEPGCETAGERSWNGIVFETPLIRPIPALGHDNTGYHDNGDGQTHEICCARCGESSGRSEPHVYEHYVCTLCGARAGIPYLDPTDENEPVKYCTEFEVYTGQQALWNDVWYVVNRDVQISQRMKAVGTVNLILCDGATLSVPKGVTVASGSKLILWAQSDGENMGALIADQSAENQAAIGGIENGTLGTITINGGRITVVGGANAAGIGGGYGQNNPEGNIVFNGGCITATGGTNAAGIGCGAQCTNNYITVNGGSVTAYGGENGAGIGGGTGSPGGKIAVNGGSVTATGGENGAGIGSGSGSNTTGTKVTVNGGSVTATGGSNGAGIGGGSGVGGGNVDINGGSVTAIGSGEAAGIGGGANNWGGFIIIRGGQVIANGGSSGPGIGAGSGSTGGILTLFLTQEGDSLKASSFACSVMVADPNNGDRPGCVRDENGRLYILFLTEEEKAAAAGQTLTAWSYTITLHFSVPAGAEQPDDISCELGDSLLLPELSFVWTEVGEESERVYQFRGWVIGPRDHVEWEENEEWDRYPFYTGEYYPTADVTLHALFSSYLRGSDRFRLVQEAPADWTGRYCITGAKSGTAPNSADYYENAYILKACPDGTSYETVTDSIDRLASVCNGYSSDELLDLDSRYVFEIAEGQPGSGNYTIRSSKYWDPQTGALNTDRTYLAITNLEHNFQELYALSEYAPATCDWDLSYEDNDLFLKLAAGGSHPYLEYAPCFWDTNQYSFVAFARKLYTLRLWKQGSIYDYTTILGEQQAEIWVVDQTNSEGFYAYIYNSETDSNDGTAWPGHPLTLIGQDFEGNNYYSFQVDLLRNDTVIFNNGAGAQNSDENALHLANVTGEKLAVYNNSQWQASIGTDIWVGEGELTLEPGCETAGERTWTGIVFETPLTRSIDALGHDYTACRDNGDGQTHSIVCARCGEPNGVTEPHVFEHYVCTLCGAHTAVPYLDPTDENEPVKYCTEFEVYTGQDTLEDGVWYVVTEDVSVWRITIYRTANLILCDGATLTTEGVAVGNSSDLTVWAQSEGDGMGALIADASRIVSPSETWAGIGGTSNWEMGNITINGGAITAMGAPGNDYYTGSAGIGPGGKRIIDAYPVIGIGNITINGGRVNAVGGSEAAGIGGIRGITHSTVTVNGGVVSATGGSGGPGIVGGYEGNAVIINGGDVTAVGGFKAPGIGVSERVTDLDDNPPESFITITGGTVSATGGLYGAGIVSSSRYSSSWDVYRPVTTVAITGGTVTATGGNYGAGIGGSDQTLCGSVYISGGSVTAYGGQYAAGIGSGDDCVNNSDVYGLDVLIAISGGTVTAEGGSEAAGIGGGRFSAGLNVEITGGTVTVSAEKDVNAEKIGHGRPSSGVLNEGNLDYPGMKVGAVDPDSGEVSEWASELDRDWYCRDKDDYSCIRLTVCEPHVYSLQDNGETHGGVCEFCGTEIAEAHVWGEASYVWAADDLSCVGSYVCSVCQHAETETAAAEAQVSLAPTCTEQGQTTYTAVFTDPLFETQTKTVTDIPALGHDLIHHAGQEPTCTEPGWEAYETCSRCDYTTYEEIPTLGHDLIHHAAQEPTCTEPGWAAYETCSRCDYSTYEELPALGHDLIHHAAQEPTCTEPGWEAYETCSRCDFSTYQETPALGHLPGEPVQENYVEPGVGVEGGYDMVTYCQRCGALLESVHTTLPAIEEDPALHVFTSISVGTDMIIGITARKSEVSGYERFWIEVVKHGPEGDTVYRYGPDQAEPLTENPASWRASFRHIYAKEMGVEIEARLCAQDASGKIYVSPARTTCIRDYLADRLTATNNRVEQRVLAADMLNYGAAAQRFMDYDAEHLVNKELSDEALAKLREYETTEEPLVEKTNSNLVPEGQEEILFNSVTLGNEVVLTLTVALPEEAETVQVLVRDHVSGETVAVLDASLTRSSYQAEFRDIGADKMRTEYDFVTLVDGVETGNIRTWSVEGYVGEIRSGSLPLKTAMANALLVYGDSAAAYFAAQ